MLAHSGLSTKYWVDAFLIATYLINRLPTATLSNYTPFFKLFSRHPDYSFLLTFGCACFPLMRPYNLHKVAFRSKKCIFLGYSSNHHGYRCLDLTTHRIFSSRDVVFNELDFLAKTTPSLPLPNEVSRSAEHVLLPLPSPLGNSLSFSTLPQADTQPLPIDQTPPTAPPDDTQPLPTDLTPPIPDLPLTTQLVEPIPAPTTSHRMVTRSMTSALRPKPFHDHQLYYSTCHPLKAFLANALPFEPSTFFQAYKVPEW